MAEIEKRVMEKNYLYADDAQKLAKAKKEGKYYKRVKCPKAAIGELMCQKHHEPTRVFKVDFSFTIDYSYLQ